MSRLGKFIFFSGACRLKCAGLLVLRTSMSRVMCEQHLRASYRSIVSANLLWPGCVAVNMI